jgi:lipopolysaccharide export system permease protein
MVLGRMYRDQEMAILASSGVGPLRLYRSLAILVVPLGLLSTQLAWEVMPWTDRQSQQLLRQDEKSADVRGIKPGKFNEFSRGDVVLYAESKSGDEEGLSNIFVQSRHGEMAGVVTARDGYLRSNEDGEHFVVLRNGQRYQGSPGRADFIISNFDEYAVRIEEARGEDLVLKRAALPSRMLLYSKTPRDWVELQRRLAIPLGLFSLALLAVPLSRVAPRGGVYGNVLAAFMIYIIYENLQKLFQALVIGGKTPLWIGFGGVYVFMVLLAVLLLARENNYTWFRRAVRVEKNP